VPVSAMDSSAAAAAEWTTESVVNSRPGVALNGYEWSDVQRTRRRAISPAGRPPSGPDSTGHCHGYAFSAYLEY